MSLKCGIVGLPNVGKSTLFNALTKSGIAAENYPFCTIEPNVGIVEVPDARLAKLAEIVKPQKVQPAIVEFVDIAGLVAGASKGEGLGNQFLAHIREVDAVAYVLRCFENPDIAHVEGRIDPIGDADTVETELMIADMESLERRREPLAKKAVSGDKEARTQIALIDKALALVGAGTPARFARLAPEEQRPFRHLQLLTAKPVVYVCNVDEASAGGNALSQRVEERARAQGAGCVVISARIEAELAALEPEERAIYLAELGLSEPGLNRLIREGYRVLDLVTFFTAGPKEARAWTVPAGTRAPRAAGTIHTDFERGFIRAETIAYDDFVAFGGEQGAKQAGKMRLEGKDYVVRDGDVMLFRFAN